MFYLVLKCDRSEAMIHGTIFKSSFKMVHYEVYLNLLLGM